MRGKPGRPRGSIQTAEARAKVSEALRARWRDPVFREKHVARLRGQQAKATQAAHAARQLYLAAVRQREATL